MHASPCSTLLTKGCYQSYIKRLKFTECVFSSTFIVYCSLIYFVSQQAVLCCLYVVSLYCNQLIVTLRYWKLVLVLSYGCWGRKTCCSCCSCCRNDAYSSPIPYCVLLLSNLFLPAFVPDFPTAASLPLKRNIYCIIVRLYTIAHTAANVHIRYIAPSTKHLLQNTSIPPLFPPSFSPTNNLSFTLPSSLHSPHSPSLTLIPHTLPFYFPN